MDQFVAFQFRAPIQRTPKKKPYDDKKEPEVTQTKLSFANVDQRQLAANTKAAFGKSEREYASPEAGLKRAKRQHEDHQRRLQSHKKKPEEAETRSQSEKEHRLGPTLVARQPTKQNLYVRNRLVGAGLHDGQHPHNVS